MLEVKTVQKRGTTNNLSNSGYVVLDSTGSATVVRRGHYNAGQNDQRSHQRELYKVAKRRKSPGTGQGQGLYGRSQKNEIGSRRKKRRKRKVSVAKAISGNTYVSIRQEKILAVGDARGRQVELIQ